MNEIEIKQIDTRFEGLRLKDGLQEKTLLGSVLEQGMRDPLQCVVKPEGRYILLDGFKRYRCAVRLGMKTVPVVSLGSCEAEAMLQLMRLSNAKSIHILEQAGFVDELKTTYGMSIYEIAHYLERSPAWVSVRLGMLGEMSCVVREAIFSGRFPARSYMYSLRGFTRVNKVKKSEVDEFVRAISGKRLSIRNIDILAYGFFRGGDRLKEQIKKGNLNWTLNQLKGCDEWTSGEGCTLTEAEKTVLRDLELTQKYMTRVLSGIMDSRLKNDSFFLQAHLLVEGILNKTSIFIQTLQGFYDSRRKAQSDSDTLPRGAG